MRKYIDIVRYFGILICFSVCFSVYPQQKIEDFYLSNYKNNGEKEWEVKGEKALVSERYVKIDQMKAKYFREDDTIDIKADKAHLDKENMNVYLNNDVHINSKKGIELETSTLSWEQNKNRVYTDEKVEIRKESALKVEAKGMNADTELNKVSFGKEVKVNLFSKDGVINIKCNGPLEINYNEGKAIFNNNVVVDNIQGKMFANKATVYFDTVNSQVNKVVAEGDVKVIRDDNVTFAERAIYFQKENKITLEGQPRLIIFPKGKSKSFFGRRDENP